jgi:hypothetical protein
MRVREIVARRLWAAVMALVAAAGATVVIAPAARADTLDRSWKLNSKETSWCRWPSRFKLCGQVYEDEAKWALRHAAACGLDICANGDEQNAVQHCLGSSVMKVNTYAVTADTYAHIAVAQQREAAERLGEAFPW